MGNENSGRHDIFTIIREHYVNADPELSIYDIGLPPSYIQILERWIFIDIQRSKNYPRKNTKEILALWQRKFLNEQGKPLSAAQFYIDLRNCERMFGEALQINKEYEKRLALATYDMLLSQALARGDLKSAIEAQKRKDAITQIEKAEGDALPFDNGERKYEMSITMVLDGKKVGEKNIDISALQNLPIKDVREYAILVDRPEADIDTMDRYLDELEEKKDGE